MKFDLVPGNQEISEILAAQVTGMYRYVNDGNPYVTITPASGASITVRGNDRLRLKQHAQSKVTDQPLTFVVMFDETTMELFLAELFLPGAQMPKKSPTQRRVRLEKPVAEMQPEGGVQVPARPQKRMTLVPGPEPSRPAAVTVPDALKALVTREDVHPELGDYLVMPIAQASMPEEPPWVVRSAHVEQTHVVQPRLGMDRIVGAL